MAWPRDGDWNKPPYENGVQAAAYENTENENYPLHWHTAVEIIMTLEKEYELTLLKKIYRLRENDILIVPSCELHRISVPPGAEGGRRFILLFEPELFCSLPGFSGELSPWYAANLITPEETPALYKTVLGLLMAIREEYRRGDILRGAAVYGKIIELYVALARYRCGSKPPGRQTDRRQEYIARLNRAFEYIEEHITEELTLETIAGIVNLSKFHFARIFKKFTGLSFNRYVRQKRVKKAETLLLNGEHSIADAALDAGFESITTFNRVFKEIKRCTPSEYKKRYLRSLPIND